MKGTKAGSSRRRFLGGAVVASLPMIASFLSKPAHAADYVLKFGHSQANRHPAHKDAVEAARRIAEETKGRLQVRVFPNS